MTGAPAQPPDHPRPDGDPMSAGDWVVTLVLCLLFATIGAFWQKAATLPHIRVGLCEAVPPVPAIATLIFLLLAQAMLRRRRPSAARG